MLKNPTETYNETRKQIAKRIVTSPLAMYLGYGGLAGRDGERLFAIAEGAGDPNSWTYISAEFRRADTNVHLEIRCEACGRMRDGGPELDQDGNEWCEYELNTEVGYPSHGSADPATVMARAALITEVALFAAAIKADFGRRRLLRMSNTAAELAEKKAKQEEQRINTALRNLVLQHRNGMRVNGRSRVTSGAETTGKIPAGYYDVNVGNADGTMKSYKVFVTETAGASIDRVA